MNRMFAAAAVAAALLVAGCGDDDDDASPVTSQPYALDGTSWSYCHVEENFPQDAWNTFTFIGGTMHATQLEYSSSDSTCSGTAHGNPGDAFSAAFTDLGATTATLDGAPVAARSVRLTDGGQPVDGVMYLDAAQDPDALYLAFDSPTVLSPRPHSKEAPSSVTAAALQGAWVSCITEDLLDRREVLTFAGYAVSVVATTHTSADGSCTGTATPEFESVGVAVLRADTPATLDGAAVTARQADVVFASGDALHSIVYIDAAATPDVLYTGDELATVGLDGATTARRPTVLQAWRPRKKQ